MNLIFLVNMLQSSTISYDSCSSTPLFTTQAQQWQCTQNWYNMISSCKTRTRDHSCDYEGKKNDLVFFQGKFRNKPTSI